MSFAQYGEDTGNPAATDRELAFWETAMMRRPGKCLFPVRMIPWEEDFTHVAAMVLAFVLPFTVHMVVGNVLEPLLFGHSLELAPVVILLSLMQGYTVHLATSAVQGYLYEIMTCVEYVSHV